MHTDPCFVERINFREAIFVQYGDYLWISLSCFWIDRLDWIGLIGFGFDFLNLSKG